MDKHVLYVKSESRPDDAFIKRWIFVCCLCFVFKLRFQLPLLYYCCRLSTLGNIWATEKYNGLTHFVLFLSTKRNREKLISFRWGLVPILNYVCAQAIIIWINVLQIKKKKKVTIIIQWYVWVRRLNRVDVLNSCTEKIFFKTGQQSKPSSKEQIVKGIFSPVLKNIRLGRLWVILPNSRANLLANDITPYTSPSRVRLYC